MSCSVSHRCGWDSALLWLWCRPAAIAPIQPLAWDPPCAVGAALKTLKKKRKKKKAKLDPGSLIWGFCVHRLLPGMCIQALFGLRRLWGQLFSSILIPSCWSNCSLKQAECVLIKAFAHTMTLARKALPQMTTWCILCLVQDSAQIPFYWRKLPSLFPHSVFFSIAAFKNCHTMHFFIHCYFPAPECKLYEGKALFTSVFSGPRTVLGT